MVKDRPASSDGKEEEMEKMITESHAETREYEDRLLPNNFGQAKQRWGSGCVLKGLR